MPPWKTRYESVVAEPLIAEACPAAPRGCRAGPVVGRLYPGPGLSTSGAARGYRIQTGRRLESRGTGRCAGAWRVVARSEEHTSELQSLMRISYAVFCLKKKKKHTYHK